MPRHHLQHWLISAHALPGCTCTRASSSSLASSTSTGALSLAGRRVACPSSPVSQRVARPWSPRPSHLAHPSSTPECVVLILVHAVLIPLRPRSHRIRAPHIVLVLVRPSLSSSSPESHRVPSPSPPSQIDRRWPPLIVHVSNACAYVCVCV